MTWKVLEEIDGKIQKLRAQTEKATRPAPAESRELLSVLYQEVSFRENDLSLQKITFYNGDRDTLVIQRLAATVVVEYAVEVAPATEEIRRFSLQKTPVGWGAPNRWWSPPAVVVTDFDIPTVFDFQWNYVVNSRQSQYSRSACCSDMLVGLDKGQMLDFRIPIVIPKSESIEFQVQPLRYMLPDNIYKRASTKYYVGFCGLGYRSMP